MNAMTIRPLLGRFLMPALFALGMSIASTDSLADENRIVDLYIVAGQSNAVGADSDPATLESDVNDSDVLFWWKCGDPPADDHDSSSGDAWLTLMPQHLGDPITPKNHKTRQYGNFMFTAGGFGPEIGLARQLMSDHGDRPHRFPAIAVLKVAFSGTSVENDWSPAQAEQPGNCLGALIEQFGRAKQEAEKLGLTLRPRAMLWIQGESDSAPDRAANYVARLTATIQAIRTTVDQPDLAVRLAVNTKFGPENPEAMEAIVAAQKTVANQIGHCQYVDTSSATIANNAHYDSAGSLLVGEMMADSLRELSQPSVASESTNPAKRWKVLVAGGHPDDPETGCGGTIAKYVAQGHDVSMLYLTTGEAGIDGVSHDKASEIRRQEATRAAVLLGAKPIFFGQIDGESTINGEAYERMRDVVSALAPDVIFTHWPIDTHRDHRHCTMLVYDAWLRGGSNAALYYYEVMTGSQTQTFLPTDFVDISDTLKTKHQACFVHQSQHIERDYPGDHGLMEKFRGKQTSAITAEAFMRQTPGPDRRLPDVQ
ncbi:Mycothiol S-conjugate amidase [Rubripirellula tenax]|uniref:Mycothiol S-conjugate amidase n=1 Tax=Rubripirellula tenax TaxID=2528015 RepID=A0A5C6F7H6_9BACT|nr:PIG-L family deacetylase [Rubripirellula tenax]TWU56424.1 Mycothiol S-conjugate amidase [Rubripirellula tenax]